MLTILTNLKVCTIPENIITELLQKPSCKVCLFKKKSKVTQGGLETSGKNNRNKMGCVEMRRIIFEFLGRPYKATTYQLRGMWG